MLEQDHLLPDFQNKFIPVLADYVDAIADNAINKEELNKFYNSYKDDKSVAQLLLSPFLLTGKLKSLLITHNSWFVNVIVPKVFNRNILIKDFEINIEHLFQNMKFELWMDNGSAMPSSAKSKIPVKL